VIAEAGHYALVLALGLALIQSTVPLLGARCGDHALMNVARSSALAQLLFVAASFALPCSRDVGFSSSTCSRIRTDEALYKITGVWGN
jgi:cytochrome c-type biogenesis protein CcmF